VAYTVELAPAAERQLDKLPNEARDRIARALAKLGQTPRPPGCRKMAGPEGFHRIRIGDYRAIYQIRDAVLVVLVVKIGHRREVYRGG